MKVLLVGMSNRNFLIDLQNNLPKQQIAVDLLDLLEGYFIDFAGNKKVYGQKIVSKNFFKKNIQLYFNFYRIFNYFMTQNIHYDICNIHFLDPRYFFFKKQLAKLANRMVISMYGSDFYLYKKYDFFQKPLYKKAAALTFANDKTRKSFDEYYHHKFSDKFAICRFGLSLLPLIKNAEEDTSAKHTALRDFNFPSDKIIITIGINSSPNNQQLEVIDALNQIDDALKSNIFLVFPMTYGGFTNYCNDVDSAMAKTQIPYCILRNYLSTDELVSLRIASDLMINLPITDQLSATMCEYLFTKNWVITGAWLPYEPIDQTGVNYHRIQGIDELSSQLTDVLEHFSDYQQLAEQNPKRIWNFSSWSHNITSWIEVYNT